MKLIIQFISKPEMTVQEAALYISDHLPEKVSGKERVVRSDLQAGIITVDLNQDSLTDVQRDWLHLTPFAARYIDSYRVEHLDERWTLQGAGDHAEERYGDIEETTVAEALWFMTIVNARTGEQVERVASALERIATVLESR